MYEAFKDKVRHKKIDLHLTNADIAKMTGFATNTIDVFMSKLDNRDTRGDSDKVAKAIAAALEIEL